MITTVLLILCALYSWRNWNFMLWINLIREMAGKEIEFGYRKRIWAFVMACVFSIIAFVNIAYHLWSL